MIFRDVPVGGKSDSNITSIVTLYDVEVLVFHSLVKDVPIVKTTVVVALAGPANFFLCF